MMVYAVVGSRQRQDRANVEAFVDGLLPEDEVVSGGCAGPDTWAVERAKARGLKTTVILPELRAGMRHFERTRAFHERNRKVAEACEAMAAFVAPDRRGGTENAVRHAKRLGKPVILL